MQDSAVLLERIKRQLKRNARLAYAAQERERRSIEDAHQRTVDALDSSRSAEAHQQEVAWMAESQAYRLRLEMQRRREEQRLLQQTEVVRQHRDQLKRADQEARLMEKLAEKKAAARAEISRRAESHELDDLAINQWRSRWE